ncbi:hypothetical protein B0T17DRAFT_537541 [Bombardia bombarda]|uniref:Uncharacterized protein n=1 Tax=Bombardia bombarda TaxID=252184 RepID=A0AA40BYJ9_9PEZI|nr:hypothetical protein B0T17DRAFT_537541 [Bombardia bombarda]
MRAVAVICTAVAVVAVALSPVYCIVASAHHSHHFQHCPSHLVQKQKVVGTSRGTFFLYPVVEPRQYRDPGSCRVYHATQGKVSIQKGNKQAGGKGYSKGPACLVPLRPLVKCPAASALVYQRAIFQHSRARLTIWHGSTH